MDEIPSILAPVPLETLPTVIDLEPVHNCNLRCRSCHVPQEDLTKEALPIEAIAKLGERDGAICKVGTTHEPTTHPDFPTLINVLGELGYRVGLTTNGTLLTERMLDAIADYSVFQGVSISFDAASPERYEYLRVGAKFEPTIERIKSFIARLDRSRTEVYVNYTMLRSNLDEINAAIDLWESIGVDGMVLLVSSDRQGNTFLQDQMLASAPDLFHDAVESAARHLIDADRSITIASPLMESEGFQQRHGHLITDGIMSARPPKKRPVPAVPDLYPGKCSSPLKELRIRWNGHAYLCNNRFLIGNLREQTLEEIWTGQRAQLARKLVAANGRHCVECGYFHYCLSRRTDLDISEALKTAMKLGAAQDTA